MSGVSKPDGSYEYEPWYKYGVRFLFFEAAIAIGVSIYALSMAFSGQAVQFKKKVTFDKPQTTIEAEAVTKGKQDPGNTIAPPENK